jgi:hypothetical protein
MADFCGSDSKLFILGRIVIVIIAVIVTIAAIACGYLIYLRASSARISDNKALPVSYVGAEDEIDPGLASEGGGARLQAGTPYRAITYNVGFGAYDHDFSFFMSEGRTAGGDDVKGMMSRAAGEGAVRGNIGVAMDAAVMQQPDFALFQEVDVAAGRSYSVNELALISKAFSDGASGDDGGDGSGFLAYTYATNFHTGYLFWPPARPMGKVKDSGIATYSRYFASAAERRSLPVDESFLGRLTDLDRCFSVMRLPVDGAGPLKAAPGPGGDGGSGSELVLVNVHLSAYDAGEKMHGAQMEALADFMKAEREKGNWIIAGGDWNQCFPGSVDAFTGRMETPKWAKPFMEGALPEGFSLVSAGNADIIATCRDTSIPWTPGVSYETILDGWAVSDNVSASAVNIDTDYAASDHNPVLLTFTLR